MDLLQKEVIRMNIGDTAPQFTVPNQNGEKVSLSDFNGKWIILYFYPKDNTPGCTIEAIDFTARKAKFEKLNAVVLGVSKDSPKSHCNFMEKQNLTIILLSDEEKEVQQKYEAWGPKKFMGREFTGTLRSTVLINPKGKIAFHWKNVKAKGHAEEVLEKLRKISG
jgi:thioredoxin-dependent peroxiredoxin